MALAEIIPADIVSVTETTNGVVSHAALLVGCLLSELRRRNDDALQSPDEAVEFSLLKVTVLVDVFDIEECFDCVKPLVSKICIS